MSIQKFYSSLYTRKFVLKYIYVIHSLTRQLTIDNKILFEKSLSQNYKLQTKHVLSQKTKYTSNKGKYFSIFNLMADKKYGVIE